MNKNIFYISGGKELSGSIQVSGAKNAALPIMIASIMTEGEIFLRNIPLLSDTKNTIKLLKSLGSEVNIESLNYKNFNQEINIKPSINNKCVITNEIANKMRASIWALGPCLARFGYIKLSLPGGCKLGARKIDMHLKALEKMGAFISLEDEYLIAKSNSKLKAIKHRFPLISVGATINIIMAACLAEGTTILSNCAIEPEIIDLCNFLVSMGAKINWTQNREVTIEGVKNLTSSNYNILPDRIEAISYIVAAAMTRSELSIEGINRNIIDNMFSILKEASIDFVPMDDKIIVKKSYVKIKAGRLSTMPYPGPATDIQAQFTALYSIADGKSIIEENIFENRFMHVEELNKMGADISVSGNTAYINGVKSLKGASLRAADLRGSVSLVLAALSAKGESIIKDIWHIDRGYANIETKLKNCGADIERIEDEKLFNGNVA